MNSKNSENFIKKQKLQERITFFINNNRSSKRKKSNYTNNTYKEKENNENIIKNHKKAEENLKKSISIKKEIGKMAEPRFKIAHFEKLLPKFYKQIDISSSLFSNGSYHQITNSEIEMLEIDEKLP